MIAQELASNQKLFMLSVSGQEAVDSDADATFSRRKLIAGFAATAPLVAAAVKSRKSGLRAPGMTRPIPAARARSQSTEARPSSAAPTRTGRNGRSPGRSRARASLLTSRQRAARKTSRPST